MLERLRSYPPRFVLGHPIRAARNLVGNHRSRLADRHLQGLHGVEIGGSAHNSFFLDTVNVDYTEWPSTAEDQLRYCGRVMAVDVTAPAHRLPFGDGEFDFLLASHVLEHVPDPIGALREWQRVARLLLVVLPGRDNPYDRARPLTPIDELEERHREGLTSGEDRHWSVWDSTSFVALCEHLGLGVLEVQDPDDKRGNGFAVVLDVRAG